MCTPKKRLRGESSLYIVINVIITIINNMLLDGIELGSHMQT